MGKTSIEWTDASWNPIVGCTEVSPGCANCYAARLAATRLRETPAYQGLAKPRGGMNPLDVEVGQGVTVVPRWTGQVRFLPERLQEPLHWKQPRRIFVCDMGDLFHEAVTWEMISKVWLTMYLAKHHIFHHTFQVPGWLLWCFGCAGFVYAIVQDVRAHYWKKKYYELRDSPVMREVARQLSSDQQTYEEMHPVHGSNRWCNVYGGLFPKESQCRFCRKP